ncbi:MAG: hypothetical protein ACKOQ8_01370, partial [Micrococcales bacterium]
MSSNKSFIGRLRDAKIGTTLIMLFVVVVWFLPTAGLLVTAFRTKTASVESGWWTAIFDPFNQVWTLDAFKGVLFSEQWNLADAFMNTLGIAVPATILPITFAAFAAYGFTFLNFKFKEGWFALIIALMIVPLQAVIVAILQMFGAVDAWLLTIPGNEYGDLKLSGNYPAGWIVHAAFAMPL